MMTRFIRGFLIIVVLVAVAFVLGYVIVDKMVMPRLVGFGKELDVPDVTGRTLTEAKAVLHDAGLRYNVDEQRYDDIVPLGFVISQKPMPNQRIKEGGLVSLVTSLGQEKVVIPQLVDLSIVQAKSLIERMGLKVGRVDTAYSDTVRGGRIVSTNPPPDSVVYRGTSVNFTVSGAKATFFAMPDFLGQTFDSVRDSILALGLEIGDVKILETSDSQKGMILLQSPPAGMTVKRGDKIIFAISSGRL
ncbi:PASTA domain-containing protein [candidate division TA06 bacterium]|uniref:PASTA domain-containing protein n=1 Tax=candidate division TA06 bacterium TaxID=2250710 RepID=A0A523XTV2_UNCT6|nr:MAG: PASTA domain-containing protein [candidate division TA06 bacterium]